MVDGGDIIELLLCLGGGDIIELLLLDAGDMLLDNDDFDNGAMEPRKVAYAINPVSHGVDLPVSEPNVTMESSSDSESGDMTDTVECGAYRPEEDDQPVPLTQAELNDLTQGLNLSKESPSYWVLVFKRNVYWYLEQHSIGIENARENLDICSQLIKHFHWPTVTILLA